MASWKRTFASGLILIGPILVTLYVVYRAYAIVTGITPTPTFDAAMLAGTIGHEPTRMLIVRLLQITASLSAFLLLTIAVGVLTRTTIGDVFARTVDGIANRVPGLRVVYNASKIAAETTLGTEQALQEPVRVQSWDDVEMPAFKTGHTTDDGRVVLFIPTAPNVSSGFVVEADADRVTETDETVEETLARVLSGGFGESKHPQKSDPTVPFDTADDRTTDEERR
ncbi:DUF502 domain-containing protein [Natrinema ejinorense]|uniref:DUF502 domain-containing protein n=1 Tax=Natrinema ejinorense TaxID=373386 RepID=A0A2A5QWV1_9EURY|nr:DUF502 domain-containing protein [Natrinema ejinorense]PCR91229.1 hypothetical protein CP557_12250 [Natrinema ejinorense]